MIESRISVDKLYLMSADMPEEKVLLYTVICSLPQKYRDLLLMYYYQDMPVREIAAALGKSTASVYRRLKEARQILKTSL